MCCQFRNRDNLEQSDIVPRYFYYFSRDRNKWISLNKVSGYCFVRVARAFATIRVFSLAHRIERALAVRYIIIVKIVFNGFRVIYSPQ